jgi:hypothetical protein
MDIEAAVQELDRQEKSAIDLFIIYKRDGNVQDLIQAEFAIGKLAGKVEVIEALTGKPLSNMYKSALVTLRDEVDAALVQATEKAFAG